MTKDIFTPTGYFVLCDEQADKSYTNWYFHFLQMWVIKTVPDVTNYDKFVFWFKDDKLDKVDFTKDFKVVKTYTREQWIAGVSFDLDSRTDNEVSLSYAMEYTDHEEIFVKRIKLQYSFTPISDDIFLIGVTKDSLYK